MLIGNAYCRSPSLFKRQIPLIVYIPLQCGLRCIANAHNEIQTTCCKEFTELIGKAAVEVIRKPGYTFTSLVRLTGSTEQAPLEWKPINTMRPNAIKLLITGSRSFEKYDAFCDYVNQFVDLHPDCAFHILSGGALGTDSLAQSYARVWGLPITIIYPNWKRYGRHADSIRTEQLVRMATHALLFWDGKSEGTKLTIDLCAKSPHVDSYTIHI